MLCKNCKLVEMRVEKVEDNNATHICKKCGYSVTAEIPKSNQDKDET